MPDLLSTLPDFRQREARARRRGSRRRYRSFRSSIGWRSRCITLNVPGSKADLVGART